VGGNRPSLGSAGQQTQASLLALKWRTGAGTPVWESPPCCCSMDVVPRLDAQARKLVLEAVGEGISADQRPQSRLQCSCRRSRALEIHGVVNSAMRGDGWALA